MNLMARPILAAVVATALLGSGIAVGKECRGINFPEQVQVEGSTLSLNGIGLRQATFLKINVYVAALYVAKTSTDPRVLLAAPGPSELVIQFVRDVGASDLRKGWDDGFAKNAGAQLPTLKDRIATLNGWMSDVKTGQRLIFIHKPGVGIEVSLNGAVKGVVKGDDFAHALLSIWLGAEPESPDLKSGLLGGPCG